MTDTTRDRALRALDELKVFLKAKDSTATDIQIAYDNVNWITTAIWRCRHAIKEQ